MTGNDKAMRDLLAKYFTQVYSPNSISGGILQASRPNAIADWNEEEDTRRSKRNIASFIKNADLAITRMATRKP